MAAAPAAQGPLTAVLVVALVVVIGQIEGRLLHPVVMSWAVGLPPVVVALSVVAGAVAAGMVAVLWPVRQALRPVAGRASGEDG